MAEKLTNYRIDELEKKVDRLSTNLEKLMTNHIPHLKEDILGLKTRMNIYTAINIGAIILTLLFEKFIK